MRASVRMTRYLESWGAAKPFANLHHRDCMTADNGKINTTVSTNARARAPSRGQGSTGRLNDAMLFPGRPDGPVSLPEEREVSASASVSSAAAAFGVFA